MFFDIQREFLFSMESLWHVGRKWVLHSPEWAVGNICIIQKSAKITSVGVLSPHPKAAPDNPECKNPKQQLKQVVCYFALICPFKGHYILCGINLPHTS